MGNNPSTTNARPHSSSPAGSTHSGPAPRREPKLRDNLQSPRVAAPPEPSLAQARGTSVSHRPRNSQSTSRHGTPHLDDHSPSPKETQPKSLEKQKMNVSDAPSKPVAVPMPSHTSNLDASGSKSPYSFSQIDPYGPNTDAMSYHLTRPPRLPLPIEEEVHTPGSPIIAPTDSDAPILNVETLDEGLPRRTSNLSTTTADEDMDDMDDQELPIDKTKAVVPTEFQWLGGGEKVYVTGTIFQWSRKSKLFPIPDRPGCFAATIYVRPGTHHVRFIVDGNMTISQDLPTTVDFGNNLVNYIEVSADDVPKDIKPPSESAETPTANVQQKQEGSSRQDEKRPEDTDAKPVLRTKPVPASTRYTSDIPQYLLDLDKAEDSTAYQYAAAAVEKLPSPPSLPGFLAKPILNAATPMKDDNSVLNMPNHTVLNHLATSSIKQNVLAVSGTTRYKRKYVTTILYKPTADDI